MLMKGFRTLSPFNGRSLCSVTPKGVPTCSCPGNVILHFEGKFVVKTPGVYKALVHVFSPQNTHWANLAIIVNHVNGGGEETLCNAHSTPGKLK